MVQLKIKSKNLRKQIILQEAEKLLIENKQDINMDILARRLHVAKGTIYRYFPDKNNLLFHLLLENEAALLDITHKYQKNLKNFIIAYMNYNLRNSYKIVLLHQIEEILSDVFTSHQFLELYHLREQRILTLKGTTQAHLLKCKSTLSIRDYLSYIWSMTYGAALLLNSSFYQKNIHNNEVFIQNNIQHVLFVGKFIS
ncbi:TetR/AcrR family transcriptional regulator [Acinetobacter qingfengensis]|nr:TetR/AcrR family transcriptional regulator [Acinetobacter qingfengensis]